MRIPPVLKGRNVSRRQFITGGSALAALYAFKPPKQVFASAHTSGVVPQNTSNTFDLTIGWADVNILDKPQRVPTMNGAYPALSCVGVRAMIYA